MANLTMAHGWGRHRAESSRGCGRHIGRVGALAVALGIGLAASGGIGIATAHADDSTADPKAPPSQERDDSAAHSGSAGTPQTQTDADAGDDEPRERTDGDLADAETDERSLTPDIGRDRTGRRAATEIGPQFGHSPKITPKGAVREVDSVLASNVHDVVVQTTVTVPDITPVTSGVQFGEPASRTQIAPPTATAAVNPLIVVAKLPEPAANPGPAGPAEAPMLWAAMAFARREIAAGNTVAEGQTPISPTRTLTSQVVDLSASAEPEALPAVTVPDVLASIGAVVGNLVRAVGDFVGAVANALYGVIARVVGGLFNTAPVAAADSYSTAAGAPLTTTAGAGVLANDTDVNGNPLTAQLVTGPTSGSLSVNADGSFTYTPNVGFAGTDSFTYRASDSYTVSTAATVTVTVLAVTATPPVALDDSYDTAEAVALTVAAGSGVLGNDSGTTGSTLTAQLVTGPSHGSLTLNADGSLRYAPATNFSGVDFFTYRAVAGAEIGNTATVRITVTANGAQPPVVEVGEPDELSGAVTGQVQVASRTGDPVTYSLSAPVDPSLGTVVVDASSGAWTFTPAPRARLDSGAVPAATGRAAARMVALAADQDTVTFVIDASDGVNLVAVPVQVPIDAAEAVTTATIELDTNPINVAVRGDRLYVTTADRRVLIFDTATNAAVGEIVGVANPSTLAVVGDRLYITDSPTSGAAGSVWVVDTTTNTLLDLDPSTPAVDTIPVGAYPSAMTTDGTLLYVANVNDYTATVIDTVTNTVLDTIPVGYVPFGLALGGDRLYAVNLVHGTVTVIDTVTNTQVDVNPATPEIDAITVIAPFTGQLPALALHGDRLYIADLGGDRVWVVDTVGYAVVDRIDVGDGPAAVTVYDGRVYVANAGDGTVSVIDPATNTVVERVGVGVNANAFAVGSDHVYVVNATDRSISVITTAARPTV